MNKPLILKGNKALNKPLVLIPAITLIACVLAFSQPVGRIMEVVSIEPKTAFQRLLVKSNEMTRKGYDPHYKDGDYEQAAQLFHQALTMRLRVHRSGHIDSTNLTQILRLYFLLGECNYGQKKFTDAKRMAQYGLNFVYHNQGLIEFPKERIGRLYYCLGKTEGKLGNLEAAKENLNRSINQYTLARKDGFPGSNAIKNILLSYESAAVVGVNHFDFEYADEMLGKSFEQVRAAALKPALKEKIFNDLLLTVYNSHNQRAVSHIYQKQDPEALKALHTSLKIGYEEMDEKQYEAILYDPETFSKAEVTIGDLMQLLNENPKIYEDHVAGINVGVLAMRFGEYNACHNLYVRQINKLEKQGVNRVLSDKLAKVLHNDGECYQLERKYNLALLRQNQALQLFVLNDTFTFDAYGNPRINDELTVLNPLDFLPVLIAKAEALDGLGRCAAAAATYAAAYDYLLYQRLDRPSPIEKIQWSKLARQLFESAIRFHYEQENYAAAFIYAERSKAFTLFETLAYQQELAEQAPALLEKDADLDRRKAELEMDLAVTEEPELRRQLLDSLQKIREKLYRLRRQVVDQAEAFDLEVLDVERSRRLLRRQQMLLSYFTGEEATFLFALPQAGELTVHRLEIGKRELEASVKTITQQTLQPDAGFSTLKPAYELYKQLLQPVMGQISVGGGLLILPDGPLNYLPFEILPLESPVGKTDWATMNYLIQQYPVNYCYSATLLQEMRQPHAYIGRRVMGLAPELPRMRLGEEVFDRLDRPEEMWNQVFEQYASNGKRFAYAGSKATEEQFWSLTKRSAFFDHLLFYAHGLANDNQPQASFILLRDDKSVDSCARITGSDLLGRRLRVHSAILAACQTNFGPLREGEGIMSLTRYFAQAGVRHIMPTLYSVDARATQEVLRSYFAALDSNGVARDEALQAAKQQLILDGAAPYEWAGLISIGDTGVPPLDSRPWAMVAMALFALFLMVERRWN